MVNYARVTFLDGETCMWGVLVQNASASKYPWTKDISGPAVFSWEEEGTSQSVRIDIPKKQGNQVTFELLPSNDVNVHFDSQPR